MRLGFYDEALSLARSVGEIANLLILFVFEESALEEWRSAEEVTRRRNFAPVKVRERLERSSLGLAPIDAGRYGLLSGLGSHVGPHTRPQSYTLSDMPTLAPVFQQAGVLLVINEVAHAIAFVAIAGGQLIDVDGVPRERIDAAGNALGESIGGITVDELENLWEHVRAELAR